MRIRLTLLSLTLIASVPTASSATSNPSVVNETAELCFGQVPTIVGTPGQDVVKGTTGPT